MLILFALLVWGASFGLLGGLACTDFDSAVLIYGVSCFLSCLPALILGMTADDRSTRLLEDATKAATVVTNKAQELSDSAARAAEALPFMVKQERGGGRVYRGEMKLQFTLAVLNPTPKTYTFVRADPEFSVWPLYPGLPREEGRFDLLVAFNMPVEGVSCTSECEPKVIEPGGPGQIRVTVAMKEQLISPAFHMDFGKVTAVFNNNGKDEPFPVTVNQEPFFRAYV